MRHSVSEQTQRPKFQRSGWRARVRPSSSAGCLGLAGCSTAACVSAAFSLATVGWAAGANICKLHRGLWRLWTMRTSLTLVSPPLGLHHSAHSPISHSHTPAALCLALALLVPRCPSPRISLFSSPPLACFSSPPVSPALPHPLPPPLLCVSLPFTTSLPPQPAP